MCAQLLDLQYTLFFLKVLLQVPYAFHAVGETYSCVSYPILPLYEVIYAAHATGPHYRTHLKGSNISFFFNFLKVADVDVCAQCT